MVYDAWSLHDITFVCLTTGVTYNLCVVRDDLIVSFTCAIILCFHFQFSKTRKLQKQVMLSVGKIVFRKKNSLLSIYLVAV